MIRDTFAVLGIIALAIMMFVFIVWSNHGRPHEIRVNCTWAEISPDFSPAMREACRKAHTK
jgi:hypothetical protein